MADKTNRKVVSFDDVKNANDVKFVEVPVPEWGGPGSVMRIGSLDAAAMMRFVEANEGVAKRTAGLRLIVESWVDDDGNRIGKMEHLEMLKTRNQGVLSRVVQAILDLNGLSTKVNMDDAKNDSGETAQGVSPTVLH